MSKIHDLIPKYLLDKLQQPENAQVVMEYMQRMATHYNHGLYEDARLFWQQTQAEQIRKGAEKYSEPLNPRSWSAHELVVHAMQENVDQAHYLTALDKLTKEMRKQIEYMGNLIQQAAEAFERIEELTLKPDEVANVFHEIFIIANKMKYINGGTKNE